MLIGGVYEVLVGGKLYNSISLYRSPKEHTDIFERFLDNFKLTLNDVANNNPFKTVVLGDYNANQRTVITLRIAKYY